MLLYEQIVDRRTVKDVSTLIALSENLRLGNYEVYTRGLEALIEQLQQPGARLLLQPVFEWKHVADRNVPPLQSPCFRFELHHYLIELYETTQQKVDVLFGQSDFEAAADAALCARGVARRLLSNLLRWTAMPPEYKGCGAAPFHPEFLLALIARSLCRYHHSLFLVNYASEAHGVNTWKMGNSAQKERQVARAHAEKAHGCAALSNLLWATTNERGCNNTNKSQFENELYVCYHHAASYCGETFEKRLAHATAVLEATDRPFPDMEKVIALNERLYHLEPNASNAEAPCAITVEDLLR